ncbi:MAG: VOC family protein, partial [Steroidobacteraceae bacterium]
EVTDAEDGPALGLGANGKPFFWMSQARVGGAMHLAGVRAHYHPNYYGAFVIDLNGVNLEAVCHSPT